MKQFSTNLFLFILVFGYSTQLNAQASSLSFDGGNDYISLPSDSITSKLSAGKVSASAWVYASSATNWASILKNWGDNVTGAFHFGLNDTTGKLSISISQSDGTLVFVNSPNILTINNWHHVAFTADGNNLRLYEDGVLIDSSNYDGTLSIAAGTFIGAKPDDSGLLPSVGSLAGHWKGSIDEVRIWNRALAFCEITASANCEFNAAQNGLIAYYKFNQGIAGANNITITHLQDASGNGFDGTLNNFALSGANSNWVANGSVANGNTCSALPIPTSSTTTQSACDSLVWNNTTYLTSGTYTYLTTNASGCDSVATLILTIRHSTTSSVTASACDSLIWNGIKYTTSGTYTYSTLNSVGCDSTVTLTLTVNQSSVSVTDTSACGSYIWNGNTYTTSGTYTYSTTNAVGCDSTAKLNLTILANITSINITNRGAYCGDTASTLLGTNIGSSFGSVSYEWSKLDYNADAWQVTGSDSVLNINITTPTQYVLKTTIAGCGTFWSNQQTVMPVKSPTVSVTPNTNISICNNNVVNFIASSADSGINNFAFYQGITQVQTGTGLTYTTPNLTTANDGVIYTIEATNLKPTFDGNITENFWGVPLAVSTWGPSPGFGAGHELNAVYARVDNSNLYIAIAGNVQNSNRIMMFIDSKSGGYNTGNYGRNGIANNSIKNINNGIVFDPGFEADYCLGIGTDATTSQYYFDLVTLNGIAAGGTSINNYIGTNLSPVAGYNIGANPANNSQTNGFEFSIPKSALDYTNGDIRVFLLYSGDNGFISNQFLTRANTGAGNYGNGAVNFGAATPNPIDIPVTSLQNSCKTTVATTVAVKPNLTSTTTQTACDSLWWNGIKYTASGTYTFTSLGSNGCDSIASLNLTINNSTTSTTTTTTCDSLWWNGIKYTTSGTYTWSGMNAANCDSTATLNLTVSITPASTTIVTSTTTVIAGNTNVAYTCAAVSGANTYVWTYTGTGATIHNNGDTAITIDFDVTATSGDLRVVASTTTGCTDLPATVTITVTPLPVILSSYVVEKTNKTVLIKWSTATEINSKNFEIQRSIDGKNFTAIGNIAAKGVASEYNFIDEKPFLGINYYKLKQIDKDGKFEMSVVKSVKFEAGDKYVVNIYPNPVKTELNVRLMNTKAKQINIVNSVGKIVYTTRTISTTETIQIPVKNLSIGNYYVEIVTPNGIIVEKFIKQ